MKNYVCTGKGFLKSSGFDVNKQEYVIEYTDKVRDAQQFNTKAALKFLVNHEIMGFIWKPYEQEAIRNMYIVKKKNTYGFGSDEEKNMVEEWQVEKAFMCHESDIAFLTSKSMTSQDIMTFDEAKAEALRLNMEMMADFNEKIKILIDATEPER